MDLCRGRSLKYVTKDKASCKACGIVFCPRCGNQPHRGACPRDESYSQWVSMTERAGQEGVQPCPRCHHHIEKRGAMSPPFSRTCGVSRTEALACSGVSCKRLRYRLVNTSKSAPGLGTYFRAREAIRGIRSEYPTHHGCLGESEVTWG